MTTRPPELNFESLSPLPSAPTHTTALFNDSYNSLSFARAGEGQSLPAGGNFLISNLWGSDGSSLARAGGGGGVAAAAPDATAGTTATATSTDASVSAAPTPTMMSTFEAALQQQGATGTSTAGTSSAESSIPGTVNNSTKYSTPGPMSYASSTPGGGADTSQDYGDPYGGKLMPMWMRMAPTEDGPMIQQMLGMSSSGTSTDSTTPTSSSSSSDTTDPTQQADATTPDGQTTEQTTGTPTQVASSEGSPIQMAGYSGGTAFNSTESAGTSNPNSYFLSQENSQAAANNENCGPASLGMVLEAFNKIPAGGNPEQTIEATRQLMTGADNVYSPTDYNQIANGARKEGLTATEVNGLSGINEALANGQMVISAGNPGRAGAYGSTLPSSEYNHFNGRHVIVVTGHDGNNYTINDPLSKVGTLTVTAQQLQQFISDPSQPAGNGGVAIGNGSSGSSTVAYG